MRRQPSIEEKKDHTDDAQNMAQLADLTLLITPSARTHHHPIPPPSLPPVRCRPSPPCPASFTARQGELIQLLAAQLPLLSDDRSAQIAQDDQPKRPVSRLSQREVLDGSRLHLTRWRGCAHARCRSDNGDRRVEVVAGRGTLTGARKVHAEQVECLREFGLLPCALIGSSLVYGRRSTLVHHTSSTAMCAFGEALTPCVGGSFDGKGGKEEWVVVEPRGESVDHVEQQGGHPIEVEPMVERWEVEHGCIRRDTPEEG